MTMILNTKLGTWMYTKYTDIAWYFEKGIERIKTMLFWFPTIWKQHEWDWGFMLDVEKRKLQRTCKWYEDNNMGHLENGWYNYRNMKLCIKLLNVIAEEKPWYHYEGEYSWNSRADDSKWILHNYVNIRNADRFLDKFDMKLLEKCPNLIRMDLRPEKAWRLYCYIREKHFKYWWD